MTRKYTFRTRIPAGERTAEEIALREDKHRRQMRDKMAEKRAKGRNILIPEVINPERRERGRTDPEFFLSTYLPGKFYNPFCPHHLAMIHSLEQRILYSGKQAMAAPRGDGKSSIVEGMAGIWAIVYGYRHFVMLIGATEKDGLDRKSAIMTEYEENDLLFEDFPEICAPVRALDKAGRKGHQQAVDGEYTNIVWSSGELSKELRFPRVEGSRASGAWLLVRGMQKGKVRGTKKGNDRPDLVCLDDVEWAESVRSETITGHIEDKIMYDVMPLAGPGKRIAVFMPCTIIKLGCLADRYTDKEKYPENASWMGQRHSLVLEWPECHGAEGEADLWAVYRHKRNEDQLEGDETGRRAHKYYLDNREPMDAGCNISNTHRFDPTECPDGSHLQASAIQAVMDNIADGGNNEKAWAAFNAEYQNQPDESNAPEGSDCNEAIIKQAVNAVPKGFCPPGTTHLTAGLDLHKKRIFWVVVAWVGSHAHIVDYGIDTVYSPEVSMIGDKEVTEDVKRALFTALCEWRDREEEGRPILDTGEVRMLDRVCIDSRWMPDPVYDFVSKSARPTYQPITGSGGRVRDSYRPPRANTKDAHLGRFHYYSTRQHDHGGVWLMHADSDYWVGHIQDGFVLKTTKGDQWTLETRDAVALYGADRLLHRDIASHVMAEEFVTQFVPGKGYESKRVVKNTGNHWLDCLVYACSAGAHAGVRFGHMPERKKKKRPSGPVRVVGSSKRFARR